MSELDEKSTGYLTCTFRDKNGAAIQPSSSTYTIHDIDSAAIVRAATALAPSAGVVEIVLTKDDNTLVDPSRSVEGRRVTVNGVFGAADEVHKEFKYRLNNLAGI
ncbi:MAG: hypothetical protein ACRD1K_20640 [Acidimicrobiales bacterium]